MKFQISNFKYQISNDGLILKNWKLEIRNLKFSTGFTLVELLLVMGVAGVLFALGSITLFNSRTSTALSTTVEVVSGDLKNQQVKAMTGDTEGRGTSSPYGIYFFSTGYTLFAGTSYSSSNPTNVVIPVDESLRLTADLPSSTIIFADGSGEVNNYSAAHNTITLTEGVSGRQKVFQINQLGTIVAVD